MHSSTLEFLIILILSVLAIKKPASRACYQVNNAFWYLNTALTHMFELEKRLYLFEESDSACLSVCLSVFINYQALWVTFSAFKNYPNGI